MPDWPNYLTPRGASAPHHFKERMMSFELFVVLIIATIGLIVSWPEIKKVK
jgi:hypothetical protein